MINTIYNAATGLESFAQGLSVISENVSNLNTTGFKQQQIGFYDLGESGYGQVGNGVQNGDPYRLFNQGEIRAADSVTDLAIDGTGFFVLRVDNELRLTRAGEFEFDSNGNLVARGTDNLVQGFDGGQLHGINQLNYANSPGKATSVVKFNGTLEWNQGGTRDVEFSIYDGAGEKHNFKATFVQKGTPDGVRVWDVTVTEMGGGGFTFTQEIRYQEQAANSTAGYVPITGFSTISFLYSPQNSGRSQTLTLDFSNSVSTKDLGFSELTTTAADQDGYALGSNPVFSITAEGLLQASYNNGKTTDVGHIALANTYGTELLQSIGQNQFRVGNQNDLVFSTAGKDGMGSIRSRALEASNVELTAQFSDLIVMQRGYQASSQVITTTNEMLAVLFDIKGRR